MNPRLRVFIVVDAAELGNGRSEETYPGVVEWGYCCTNSSPRNGSSTQAEGAQRWQLLARLAIVR